MPKKSRDIATFRGPKTFFSSPFSGVFKLTYSHPSIERTISRDWLCTPIQYLPQYDHILQEDEKHKYDADTHPDIQCCHIAHFWGVLPAHFRGPLFFYYWGENLVSVYLIARCKIHFQLANFWKPMLHTV